MTCKRIGPTCSVAPVLKILGVPRLPPRGSLGTGKRGTVPKIWRAVPIFLGHANGVQTSVFLPLGSLKIVQDDLRMILIFLAGFVWFT